MGILLLYYNIYGKLCVNCGLKIRKIHSHNLAKTLKMIYKYIHYNVPVYYFISPINCIIDFSFFVKYALKKMVK